MLAKILVSNEFGVPRSYAYAWNCKGKKANQCKNQYHEKIELTTENNKNYQIIIMQLQNENNYTKANSNMILPFFTDSKVLQSMVKTDVCIQTKN